METNSFFGLLTVSADDYNVTIDNDLQIVTIVNKSTLNGEKKEMITFINRILPIFYLILNLISQQYAY